MHPGLWAALRRAAMRALILWFALAVAAVVIYVAPPYTRFYS